MADPHLRDVPADMGARADAIYERDIAPQLRLEDMGKCVLIDVISGAFEVDRDELAAADRLQARQPNAVVWMRRAGSRFGRRLGGHFLGRRLPTASPRSQESLPPISKCWSAWSFVAHRVARSRSKQSLTPVTMGA